MPQIFTINIETFVVVEVNGSILVAYRIAKFEDWRFMIIDAEEL